MRAALCACLLNLAALAGPPQADSDTEAKAYTDGVIAVQAVDSRGNPQSGARVFLRGATSPSQPEQIYRHAVSDALGHARFTALPSGIYWLDGVLAGCQLAPDSRSQILLRGPKALEQRQLILQRRPVVTGRIVDTTGAPLPNAQIQALRMTESDAGPSLTSAAQSSTDDRGVYRFGLPRPGRYWLLASHMELSFPRGSAPRSTGVVFYPNSPDLLAAQPADLVFDQPETILDITLPPAPRTEFAAGILSGPDGQPCTRCRYALHRVEGPLHYELMSGGTGRAAGFDNRGVPPGEYRVYVEDTGANPGWWAIVEAPLVEDRTTALTIRTQPPVEVSGRIRLEDLPADVSEQNGERPNAVMVQAIAAGDHFFDQRQSLSGRTELPLEQSEFALGPMPPEAFRIQVSVQGSNAYLAAIAREGRELPSPVLDFSQPGDWASLELRVRFDVAQPSFRVPATAAPGVDEPGYRLLLRPDPEDNPFGVFSPGHCAADGSCYAPPVPPGRYQVIAIGGQRDFGPNDPDLVRKLERWGSEVTLTPGENPTIELKPAPDKP